MSHFLLQKAVAERGVKSDKSMLQLHKGKLTFQPSRELSSGLKSLPWSKILAKYKS